MQNNDDVVKAIRALLKIYHEAKKTPEEIRKWLKSSLTWSARYLEMFVTSARVSVKAQEFADDMDLSKCSWNQQARLLEDPARSIFHYEHIYPVSQLRDKLIELSDPKRGVDEERIIEDIKSELNKFDIAWILKEEDSKLNEKGYKFKRPENPLDAYKAAGIELLPRDSSQS